MCILYERCEFRYVCIDTDQTPGEVIAAIVGLEIEDVDCILEELSSILQVTETEVRLYHASIGDFLFDPNRAGGLWVDERQFWARIVGYCLRLFKLSVTIGLGWVNSLTTVLRHATPTEEVTEFLSSFDSPPFLGQIRDYPLMRTALHLTWVHILNLFRERSLDIDGWKSLYHKHVSAYDNWLADLLRDEFSLSYSQRAQIAFVSFRPIPNIAVIVVSTTGIRPSCLYYQPESGFIEAWLDMFGADQLPKVKAYAKYRQQQFHTAFISWSKMRLLAVLCAFGQAPTGGNLGHGFGVEDNLRAGNYALKRHSSIPFCAALKSLDAVTPLSPKRLMGSALRSLPQLLKRVNISSHLIFTLRVALSLTFTSREVVDPWREAEKAMTAYLVGVAGLRPTMLGFVAPGDIWRYRAWDQLTHYRN